MILAMTKVKCGQHFMRLIVPEDFTVGNSMFAMNKSEITRDY